MNFLLAQVAKLVAHTIFFKSAIVIKVGNMFVKRILNSRKCDKSTKVISLPYLKIFFFLTVKKELITSVSVTTHACTHNFPTKLHKFATLLIARSMSKEIKSSKELELICEQVLFVYVSTLIPPHLTDQCNFITVLIVTREPEQTMLLFWSAACDVMPLGLHTADRR